MRVPMEAKESVESSGVVVTGGRESFDMGNQTLILSKLTQLVFESWSHVALGCLKLAYVAKASLKYLLSFFHLPSVGSI